MMIGGNLVFWLGCHGLVQQVQVSSNLALNLMFAVASFRLVERAISNQTHLAVQMLKKVSDVAEEVAVFSHLCCMFWSLTVLTVLPTILFYVYNDLTFWKWATWPPPVAFGILSSQPGRHVCPFGPLGPRCRRTGEVYCCWRKNTGKEIWWCSEMVHTPEVVEWWRENSSGCFLKLL